MGKLLAKISNILTSNALWLIIMSYIFPWADDIMQNGRRDLAKSRDTLRVNSEQLHVAVWSHRVVIIPRFGMFSVSEEKGKLSACQLTMMTSSNGNIFRVTGHLWGEFTGPRWIPRTKANDVQFWCFLWSASELTVQAGDVRRHRAHMTSQ